MLTRLRETFFGSKRRAGQIAVILILFIAILLAVFAVILNLGKVSQTKTFLTMAVDSSASLMASMFASYAEYQFQSVIEPGPNDEADWPITRRELSEFLTYVISAVIAIIGLVLIVLGAFSYGGTTAPGIWVMGIAGAVLAIGGLILYVCWVQPEQQSAWNKMFKNLTAQEKFLEQGVQTLLSYVAHDPVFINDDGDFDMDGQLYHPVNNPEEKVGRFSVLYTRRAEYLSGFAKTSPAVAADFLKALAGFLYDQQAPASANPKIFSWDPYWDITPDGFGVWDKEGGGAPTQGTYFHNESLSNCTETNPAGCPLNGSPWRIIGDPLWENPQNSFISFREMIGRDDENKLIYFNYNINSSQNPMAASASAQNMPWAEWQATDAMGLYNLLWRLDKAKTSLLSAIPSTHEGCFWCGSSGNQSWSHCPPFFTGFTLPYPEACSSNNPLYGSSNLKNCWCLKTNTDPIDVSPTTIADNVCYSQNTMAFVWKKGVNHYCSTNFPYGICATKNCPDYCASYVGGNGCCVSTTDPWCDQHPECFSSYSCGVDLNTGNSVANEFTWREDLVDMLRYDEKFGINPFILHSKQSLKVNPFNANLAPGGSLPVFVAKWLKISNTQNIQDMGGLQLWAAGLDSAKQELISLRDKTFSATSPFICPDVNTANITPTQVKDCFNATIASMQTCMNDCLNNQALCNQLATRLGIFFQEPYPTSGTYANQSTGCSFFSANYVFMKEMGNWLVKLLHRRNYLFGTTGTGGLYGDLQAAINAVDSAKNKINGFLNDPRVEAMRVAIDYISQGSDSSPGRVIYAWQDEDKPGQPPFSGKWHIVMAQAGVPTLCNNKCGRVSCNSHDGSCPEPFLPRVHSWNHKVGSYQWWSLVDLEDSEGKRKSKCGQNNSSGPWWCLGSDSCHNLESYKDVKRCFMGGMTKARVVRYDEGGSALNWATNLNFWRMRSENINATATAGNPDHIDGPQGKCQAIMNLGAHSALPDAGKSYGIAGAFILNAPSPYNQECYNLMLQLLRKGIQSESCAEYFCRQGNTDYQKSRFGVKFVPCRSNDW